MANFNKVILAGNLTRDPEVRYPAADSSGHAVDREQCERRLLLARRSSVRAADPSAAAPANDGLELRIPHG